MNVVLSTAFSQNPTVDQPTLFDSFSQHLERKYSPRSIHNHRLNINYFITYMVNTHLLGIQQAVLNLFSTAVTGYEDFLNKQVDSQSISKARKKNLLSSLSIFCSFLDEENLSPVKFNIPKTVKMKKSRLKILKKKKEDKISPSPSKLFTYRQNCSIFNHYLDEVERLDLNCKRERQYKTLYFVEFICSTTSSDVSIDDSLRHLSPHKIKNYENYLERKVELDEIEGSTAYVKLRYAKIFLDHLYLNNIIPFKYSIPPKFKQPASRRNSFTREEERYKFVEAICSNSSPHQVRNLAIVSILIDTGCRPIEICNLKLGDVSATECTLTFFSAKSQFRKLQVNKEVMAFLKDYLEIRKNIAVDTDVLFLTIENKPITTESIGSIFNKYNKLAFGKNVFSAYDLRHTYATLALDQGEPLETIAKTLGHKTWASTLYYYHRNANRLKENTISNNPLKQVIGFGH
ncbi:integrase [Paenibacillus sp. V4I9]|uniref:tyrosine-type recombinase/integrase n=1 Tax=Paenibacillus sp. V4I9 TaxID=3042308 RepID=UPI0027852F5C|nr:site-specific integrase [Paenibacillus sp. V4I9]MDQ0885008.1 integrase [Paenibacillus sp. V4I9]